MTLPRIGLMTFGDMRQDMWENYFKQRVVPLHRQAIDFLAGLPIELQAFEDVARSREIINAQVDALRAARVEALLVHTPAWCFANEVVRAVELLGVPTVLVGNRRMETMGGVAFLAAGGALSQVGVTHMRVMRNFDGQDGVELAHRLMPLFRASATAARLRGSTFGLIGGRSLGMVTGTLDPLQWHRQFGVDVEHFDQLEIIRRAPLVDGERVGRMVSWLEENAGSVEYDDEKLTREKLEFQVRCFLATKDLAAEAHLDFLSIKCMPDLSTHYVPQCITAALMPGPYDAEGERKPVVMACEADADGALTMHIMHEISGGGSVLFMDVGYVNYDTHTLYLGNCGAMSTWFAGRSPCARDNMKAVRLCPSVRPGGGAITLFTCSPGPITLARLYRIAGDYRMAIIPGETVQLTPEEQETFRAARGHHQLPMAYVRVGVDPDTLMEEFGSNHIHGVAGIYTQELVHLCELLGVEPVVMV